MPRTLKPSQIAEYCQVHSRTVSRWIASGRLKGHKLPGRGNYRVVEDDFLRFLNQQGMPVPDELLALSIRNRLLVIDDDEALLGMLDRVLSHEGFDVTTARDGFEAGVKLLDLQPSVIVLDLAMPGMNGFDVLDFVRQHPNLSHIKVLAISGTSEAELQRARDAGADETLKKPFSNQTLVNRVEQLFEQHWQGSAEEP